MREALPPPCWDGHFRRWRVSRYADVADLLGRGDLMVAEFGDGLRTLSARSGIDLSSLTGALARIPVFLNPPAHSPERRIFARILATASVSEIEGIVRRHLIRIREKALAEGGMDAAHDFADVVAMGVMVDLLDLPQADIPLLNALVAGVFAVTNHSASLPLFRNLNARASQCIDYLVDVIRRRRATPGDDVISRMLSVSPDDDERHGAARLYALLAVGTETSATFLSHAVLRLIEHPEDRAELVARPDMRGRGVEELLRLTTPARTSLRWCNEDVSIGGVMVAAGERMLLDLHAANHDAAAFRRPDSVDLENTVPHLGFSDGLHLCLGARYARVEGRLALDEILGLPPMRLLGPVDMTAEIELLPRLKSLPVAFA